MWFVDGEAVDEATLTETAVRRSQHATTVRAGHRDRQCIAVIYKARELK